MFKKSLMLALAIVSVVSMGSIVHAEEGYGTVVDLQGSEGEVSLPNPEDVVKEPDKTGSISVILTEGKKGTSFEGVSFSCKLVATIENGSYVLSEDLRESGVNLNNIQNSNELEVAATKLSGVSSGGEVGYTDEGGKLRFDGLDIGVYLVKPLNTSGYDDVTPFIVGVPTWSEAEGTMVYDISVSPKHTPVEEPPQKEEAPPTGDGVVFILVSAFILWLSGGYWAVKGRSRG